MLLHFVGENLFDTFQTLPDTGDTYDTAVESLTAHYKPKLFPEYEEALFREMMQLDATEGT